MERYKSNCCLSVVCGLVLFFFFGGCMHSVRQPSQTQFYLSPSGDDQSDGSFAHPWRTLEKARDHIRTVNTDMRQDITVYLKGGIYTLEKPFELTRADSGGNGYNIIYKALPGEYPTLSGGVRVSGWTRHTDNIWKAPLNRNKKLRALFVNGRRADMARSEGQRTSQGGWGTFTISGSEPWASTPGSEFAGVKFPAESVGLYRNPRDVELVHAHTWSETILCADRIFAEDGFTVVTFQQPYGAIALNMGWIPTRPDGSFIIRNAYELLDAPGEFYFDDAADTVYYYTRGEDMTAAEAIAPTAEGLIRIAGASTADRVHNIQFCGLTFAYDDWLLSALADSHGWVSIQSLSQFTRYVEGGNWHPSEYDDITLPPATVNVRNASSILFERNRFEHLQSAVALSLENDVIDSAVVGNRFEDLMGTSVNTGHPQHYKIGDGAQFSSAEEGVCRNILIANNFVRGVCLDFRQVEGMTGFFVQDISIVHNEVGDTPYGGIALGWWWGNAGIPPSTVARNNRINYNKVGPTHSALKDGGIIYALGEQPGSEIAYNYCFGGPRALYADDGSAYWSIHHNIIDNDVSVNENRYWLFLHCDRIHDITADHNYVRNDHVRVKAVRSPITNTIVEPAALPWSPQAQAIIDSAGLEPEYHDIRIAKN
ncbi:MAG: hypothetical protein LLF76_07415 [Planctomycetaceae bacterium]|nr:hypothetical protein [Planctomycetaceae bacterium]